MIRLALCSLLIVFASTSLSAADFLKPDEIKTLLEGKKLLVRVGNGSPFEVQLNIDGSTVTSALGGDTGTWRLSDDGYCAKWTKIRKGEEGCFRVGKNALLGLISYYVINTADGSRTDIMRID